MRCRNYDVQAKTLNKGITGIDHMAIFHDKSGAWQAKCVCDDVIDRKNNYEGNTLQPHQFETFKEELLKEPKNSRGMISISYYNGGAHILNYERINDKIIIYDAQSNTQTIITKQTKELPSNCPIYYAGGISYFRTDNKEMHMGGYYDDEYSVQVRSLNDYVEPAFIGEYYNKDESVNDFLKRQEHLRELRKIKSEKQSINAKRKQELKEKIKRLAEDYRNQQIDEWHPPQYKTKWYENLLNTAVEGFYGAVYAIQDLYEEILWRLL